MKIQYKDKTIEIEKPMPISQVLKEEIKNSNCTVLAATFNNEYKNLESEIETDGKIDLIDVSSKEGMKVYRRTLVYIVGKAFEKICPNKKMEVNYQLSNAMFCDIVDGEVTDSFIEELTQEVRRIVKEDIPIRQVVMDREEATRFFEETKTSKGRLQLDLEGNNEIFMYYCEDYYNYCYGTLANRTGCVKIFEIVRYNDGFLVRYPSQKEPDKMPKFVKNKKLAWAMEEYDDINKIMKIDRVYRINEAIEKGTIKDIILLAEALHEKKIAKIADNIAKNKNIKMILIAGPSSSGKTTFAQRLGIQLKLNRIKPVTISVDNYFVERKDTPRDENGEYDFECLEAIDLNLFNDHLTRLLNGEEVEMPEFDFYEGTKRYKGKKLKLEKDEVLVIEGIHCLNDKLTSSIPSEQKYKVYISALTVLNLDRFNRISTTDTRLIRRIVRDYQFRGYSAKHTISTWNKVNEGERNNIFPFQEESNFIFNTSLVYELGALKPIVMPLLEEITKEDKEYAEACRLINMLKYFKEIPKEYVPNNSLLKEFLGGGDFKY
mgnify:CR=1 FL=1